jgi:cytochrome c
MPRSRSAVWMLAALMCPAITVAASLSGKVIDLNGRPVAGAMVTVSLGIPGPTALTVFTDPGGAFRLPDRPDLGDSSQLKVSLRALGHELIDTRLNAEHGVAGWTLTLLAKPTLDMVASAPPSAWLARTGDHEANSTFVLDCIGCHQVPAPQFRQYVDAMTNIPGADRKDIAHRGWTAMVQYMNYVSAEEFGRGPEVAPPDAVNVYSVGDGERVINYLTQHFAAPMRELTGYEWGAPLAVTPRTTIAEYEVPRPNAVREALLLGKDQQLYVADVASDLIIRIEPATGKQTPLTIPGPSPIGPHSLHRGADGSLWMAPFVSSVVARLDVNTQQWQTWPMKSVDGKATGAHDLSFGADHTLLTDLHGNIWFSDILNNSVGYFDPRTGRSEIYRAPPLPEGRPANGALYGLAMSADQKTLWYTQLNGGRFGSFDIEKRQFGESVLLPPNAGPRRIALSDQGMLFVPLYGRGQLVEYDTRARKLIGTYDLPDRASAPYAVTWDPVRKVVWIPTSNADAIYRFNPADKSFAVLPMPRTGALIRMVDVEPDKGRLITSYGNIVENVHGPRMALIIDPGDEAYRNRPANKLVPAPVHIARVPAAAPAVASPVPPARDGASLVRSMRCYACHDLKNPLLGPPWQTIAQRYQANQEVMVDALTHKIVLGGGGNWGVVPMVPNEHVSERDARVMARWILEQRP